MRAAVLRSTGHERPYKESRPLTIEDVALVGPGPGQVLVRMASAGLCHSDLSVIDGKRSKPLPSVAGHEGAGVVEQVGEGVDDLAVGDHVVMVFVASCGECAECRAERPYLCSRSWANRSTGRLADGLRHLAAKGEELYHWSGISAFAEYAVVGRSSVVRIDPSIPLLDAAVFGCAVITGVGAVLNTAQLRPGSTAAITGLGGVGLSAVMGAALAGAETIIAIDPMPHKRELALQMGATHALAPGDSTVEQVRDLTDGGVDWAFDLAGAPRTAAGSYELTRRGGGVVLAALPAPSVTLDIPVAAFVSEGKRVLGSYMGSSVPHRDIPLYIEHHRAGRLPVHLLRSSVLSLEEINEGFDRLATGVAVRDVIRLSEAA